MKRRNWFWGIFLILAAVLIVAGQFGSFGEIGFWSILATIALVALIIRNLARLSFPGILIPASLLYMIYQEPLHLMYISPWLLILAAILASTGLSMLFRKRPKPVQYYNSYTHIEEGSNVNPPEAQVYESGNDNNPYAKVSFGAVTKYLHADNLQGGQFYTSFGSMEVYFDGVQVNPQGAALFLDCSFGAIKLYVPKHWRVLDEMNATLGGVDNDTFLATTSPDSPEVHLTGNVLLGAIEVQYI